MITMMINAEAEILLIWFAGNKFVHGFYKICKIKLLGPNQDLILFTFYWFFGGQLITQQSGKQKGYQVMGSFLSFFRSKSTTANEVHRWTQAVPQKKDKSSIGSCFFSFPLFSFPSYFPFFFLLTVKYFLGRMVPWSAIFSTSVEASPQCNLCNQARKLPGF